MFAPIFSSFPFFYGRGRGRLNTVRYHILMKEPVDGQLLAKALEITMKRYPYLMVRIKENKGKIELEQNNLPVVLLEREGPVNLNCEESNWHLMAMSYHHRSIWMDNFHGLFDGRGRSAMMKTLMYYYCSLRYGEPVTMENINLADSPIDPQEYYDPFKHRIPEGFRIKLLLPPAKPLRLTDLGLVKRCNPQVRILELDEQATIKWCKANHSTPNTLVSLAMSRAIHSLHPDHEKPIVTGVCCDFRGALHCPKSHLSLVQYVHLIFDQKMAKDDFSTQCLGVHGQLMLQSDTDEVLRYAHLFRGLFKLAEILPFASWKHRLGNAIFNMIYKQSTFCVSYSGKVSYGTCDKHIHGFYSEPEVKDAGIMIEISAADGRLALHLTQEWEEDIYFEAFREELESLGLETTLVWSGDSNLVLI